jgi:hypothetical protein
LTIGVAGWARIEAAQQDTSVSRLVGEMLRERKAEEENYEKAMKRALRRKPFGKSDGTYLTREKRMTEPVFVDSNVPVYALDERDPRKQVAAWSWRQELWRTGRRRISFQVLQECYAQLLRIWPERRTEAQAEVRDRLAWKPVAVDVAILERSWKPQHR